MLKKKKIEKIKKKKNVKKNAMYKIWRNFLVQIFNRKELCGKKITFLVHTYALWSRKKKVYFIIKNYVHINVFIKSLYNVN